MHDLLDPHRFPFVHIIILLMSDDFHDNASHIFYDINELKISLNLIFYI